MTNQKVTLWRSTAVAGAVIALSACGGGSGNGGEDSPPPTPTVSTAELVQNYVKATEALLAQQMPTSGAERFALVDACYLGNGSTKNMLVSNWSAAQAQNTAYLVGRKMANVQVLTERKTTNADGSARHERDWARARLPAALATLHDFPAALLPSGRARSHWTPRSQFHEWHDAQWLALHRCGVASRR